MSMSLNEGTVSSMAIEPWLTYIDDEVAQEDDPTMLELLPILKDLLASESETVAEDVAHRIDRCYSDIWMSVDPLAKYQEDKGMGGFLTALWETVFDLSEVVPYDDPRQDRLVNMILELRKLPARQFKVSGVDCLIYTKDPVFPMVQEDRWNGDFPNENNAKRMTTAEFQKLCEAWVNQQAFTARCTAAGIDYEPFCKHPSWEIPNGLDKDYSSPVERNCKVMVAAQYILLAGRAIYESLVNQEPLTEKDEASSNWTLKRWPLWATKLREVEERGDCDLRVIVAVTEARKRMVTLCPEIAPESAVKEKTTNTEG